VKECRSGWSWASAAAIQASSKNAIEAVVGLRRRGRGRSGRALFVVVRRSWARSPCWVRAAPHRTFAERLAHLQSLTIPAQDPDRGDLGRAFLPWPRAARGAILQPPKPEIRPCPHVAERAADRDADWEAIVENRHCCSPPWQDPMTNLPTPYAAAKIAAFLAGHPCWTAYWDKQDGLWRVSQDDPDSSLYATSRDADAVIEYIAAHS
jgi:hypothetical protein